MRTLKALAVGLFAGAALLFSHSQAAAAIPTGPILTSTRSLAGSPPAVRASFPETWTITVKNPPVSTPLMVVTIYWGGAPVKSSIVTTVGQGTCTYSPTGGYGLGSTTCVLGSMTPNQAVTISSTFSIDVRYVGGLLYSEARSNVNDLYGGFTSLSSYICP